MKRIAIIIIASVFALQGYSQQINTYSQYMQDKYAVNPAVAGSSLYSPLNFSYKQFWTGINDAPSMQTLSGHVRIYDEVGIGGKVFNYSAGPIGKTGIEGTYAYNLALNGLHSCNRYKQLLILQVKAPQNWSYHLIAYYKTLDYGFLAIVTLFTRLF